MIKFQEFVIKLKRLRFSFKQIFFQSQDKPEPVISLAAKILKSKKEIERINPYLKRLNSALSSDNIFNIALTGTYGSGKSTVVKTFQDIYKSDDPNNNFNYLNISLASFKDEILKEENKPKIKQDLKEKSIKDEDFIFNNKDNFERLLEVSILQQMIYHVKPSRIPDSRFKRIINLTNANLFLTAICFVAWLVSAFSIWQFNYFDKINPLTWTFAFKDLDFISFALIIVFLSGLGCLVFKLVRTFGNSRISKINIKGELELGENVDKSILNQHLDEIIYFFQKTKFNVVVIEDLDRFGDTEIFTKLREINLLLNNSELIKRKVVFIYAIRDDMFQGHERVKFFDYIIPIIPFINPSNASDKLTELLLKENLAEVFSKNFIDDVVTFIDDIDMRLLTNILQEYLVYKESLNHNLKQDNLLAIVIYKNIYPNDFTRLHKNEGDLYDFIAKKRSYIENLIESLKIKIQRIKEEIVDIQNESIKNEKELREVYIFNLLKQLDNPISILLDGKLVDIDNLHEDKHFNALIKCEITIYEHYYTQYGNSHFKSREKSSKNLLAIEKSVDNKFTYDQRLQLLKGRDGGRLNHLKEEMESLEEKIEVTRRWSIKEIFRTQDVNQYLGSFEDSVLMRSLLVNGYINENYLDYISLFHEVNITKRDYTFIRSVKSGQSVDFDYKIEKLENVIKKIDESHFEKVAILNHQIVEAVLTDKNKNQSRYKSLKKLLNSDIEKVFEFIDSYRKSEQTDNSVFFKEILSINKDFWNDLIAKSKFSDKKINEYFLLLINNATIFDLERISNLKSFKGHFAKLSNLGSLVENKTYTDKLKSLIKIFNTKFYDISELNYKNDYLYNYVLDNNHYEINLSNLLAIATDEGFEKEDFMTANYTCLLKLENEAVKNYIGKEIELYVQKVFLSISGNTNESEEALLLLLNNEDISVTARKSILKTTLTVFSFLNDFDNIEIKEEVIRQFVVKPSWENVIHYFKSYKENNLDSILINYLNDENVFNELNKSDLSSLNYSDDEKKDIFLAIVYCDDLSFESHLKLRTCNGNRWTGLTLKNLSSDKIESMIDEKFLTLSIDYFNKLKSDFSNLHINLIALSFYKFIADFDIYDMVEMDYIKLLESSRINEKQKSQILNKLSEKIIIGNVDISSLALKIYVNQKVDNLSFELLEGIFKNNNSDENRIKLFNLNISKVDKLEAKILIAQLGYPFKRFIIPRKQTKVNKNLLNLEFTNNLKNLGVITSNREDKGMLKVIASRE